MISHLLEELVKQNGIEMEEIDLKYKNILKEIDENYGDSDNEQN